jgi:hypothetical protein
VWLSDALSQVPRDEKFDLIVSNPPHFFTERFTDDKALSRLAPGHLRPRLAVPPRVLPGLPSQPRAERRGVVPRNGRTAKEADLLPFIKANAELVRTLPEPTVPDFFWMMSRRK